MMMMMMKKQKDLVEQIRGLGAVWEGRCVFGSGDGGWGGPSCPISDSWDRYMSPEYVVLPDLSDSDGHCGPGIQNFLLFPNPLARPSLSP